MKFQLDDDRKVQHIEVMEAMIVLVYLEFLREIIIDSQEMKD
jgi:hypothetical protein